MGRKDLELSTPFLAGRPASCNEGDYCELRRIMHFMHSAKDLEAIIGVDGIARMHAFVDLSYVAQTNMRSHTGGAISCGNGVFASDSKKKSNTKSSNEVELVDISNILPKVTFIQLFPESQGYPLVKISFIKKVNLPS